MILPPREAGTMTGAPPVAPFRERNAHITRGDRARETIPMIRIEHPQFTSPDQGSAPGMGFVDIAGDGISPL
jgi:hypothetical protein